jgi:hypothetical protein
MNAHETLPTELRMSAPPAIPQARSYLFKQRSEYTEYDMDKGAKIRINIPRLQRTYLSKDSYLRFRLNIDVTGPDTAVAAGALSLDRAGAFSLFDRIEVYDYMGGTLLEQVSNIPALVCMNNDCYTSIESFNAKLQATQGFQGSFVAATVNQLNIDGLELRTANGGAELLPQNWNSSTASKAGFATFEFSIPLLSFLGNFSNKFVPLHNGFSIDLFLNSPSQAFVCYGASQGPHNPIDPPKPPATANKFSLVGQCTLSKVGISNMEFCAQVMELGNDAENLVLASNGSGPLVIPSTFYRYFTDLVKGYNETDQSSTIGMDLNLNVVSLRNIRFGMRPASWQNNLAFPAYGHRIRNYLENFSFRYGSSFLPELAGVSCRSATLPSSKIGNSYLTYGATIGQDAFKMAGYTQAYAELMKTGPKGHWPDDSSYTNSSITAIEYMTDLLYSPSDPTNPTSSNIEFCNYSRFTSSNQVPPLQKFSQHTCGKFMAGLDLRLSSKEVISGIDTNGLLVRLNAKFNDDNLSNMVNAILDVYAEHDAFVQIIPGVATTVTF